MQIKDESPAAPTPSGGAALPLSAEERVYAEECPICHHVSSFGEGRCWICLNIALLAARRDADALAEKLDEWKSHALKLQDSHAKLEDARQRLAVEASAARRGEASLRDALDKAYEAASNPVVGLYELRAVVNTVAYAALAATPEEK